METVDEEFQAAAMDFIDRAVKADKPFFVWLSATRMHVWTRLKKESVGRTGIGLYPDGMVEHDDAVGKMLASSMNWVSPTTRLLSTAPTTAPNHSPGPMAASRRSMEKRAPPGRAVSAFPGRTLARHHQAWYRL